MSEQGLLIIGMSLVTLVPRLLPLVLHNRKVSPLVEEWMRGVPYAALAVLVFPNIFFVDSSDNYVGFIGLIVATILSIFKFPIYVTVLISILAVYGYYNWHLLFV